MYIPEFACGFIAGALVATVIIFAFALWWDRHDNDDNDSEE